MQDDVVGRGITDLKKQLHIYYGWDGSFGLQELEAKVKHKNRHILRSKV